MKKTNITTSIGTLALGNLTLNEDSISVLIDICSVSDTLKIEINKAIEIAKVEHVKKWERVIQEVCNTNPGHEKDLQQRLSYNTIWSDMVVIDCTYLDVTLASGKDAEYNIVVIFHDETNERHEGSASIKVDLSKYQNELKKIIIKAMNHDRFIA